MEKWDLYNHHGERTGKTHLRGRPLPAGYYHLVIHIWFRDEQGRFLIQRRSPGVEAHPGIWAATGGSAIVGESSLDAVRRETYEELGLQLQPEDLKLLRRFRRNHFFIDLWTAAIHSSFVRDFRPTPEVDAVAFRTAPEIGAMIQDGSFFRYGDDYLEVLGISGTGGRSH